MIVKHPLHITRAFLGFYSGFLAIQHGIFSILQGSTPPTGVVFNAIGSPCQPEAVWHACFPAMTLIPNLLFTGITAVIAGMVMIIWSIVFTSRRHSGWGLCLLSIILLLFGGGFVPVFIALVAAAASDRLINAQSNKWLTLIAKVWPWPLVIMAIWLAGSWLLGHFFSAIMLSLSGLLFVIFDLGLPVLAVLSGIGKISSKVEDGV